MCEGLVRREFLPCVQPHAIKGKEGSKDAVEAKERQVTGMIVKCQNEVSTLVENQTTLGAVDVQGDEKKMDVKRQKIEAALKNIRKDEAEAHCNAHFHGSVTPEIKAECIRVLLLHLQAGKNAHKRPKAFLNLTFGVDGAVITSHVVNQNLSTGVLWWKCQIVLVRVVRSQTLPTAHFAARCAFAALRRQWAVAVSSSVTELCSRV